MLLLRRRWVNDAWLDVIGALLEEEHYHVEEQGVASNIYGYASHAIHASECSNSRSRA